MATDKTFVIISAASRALLAARAYNGRLSGGEVQPDGRVLVELDSDVYDAMASVDPDIDTAIRVMCTTGVGHA